MIRSAAHMLVMAAIVTSALFVPAAALLWLLALALFGVSLHGFVTFGGALAAVEGLAAWWGILLIPALVYAAYVMPWHPHDTRG